MKGPGAARNVGVGLGVNQATTAEDLIDVNGDGLPDAVRKSDGCAGFSVRMNLGTSFARGEDCIGTGGWGTSGLTAVAAALDKSQANTEEDDDTDRIKGLVRTRPSRWRSTSMGAPPRLRTNTIQWERSLSSRARQATGQ